MSARSSRAAFSTSAIALALVLAAPSAALACEKDGDGGGHRGSSGAQSEHAKGDQAKGDQGKSEHDKGGKSSDKGDDKQAGKGAKGGSGSDGHNPPGNNGTIKIDYAAPADSGHANRPHPGCAFQLRMFNFDDDQTGTITFVGQAPTKLGTLLTQTHVLLSDDAAGGGQDVDEVYAYTAQQLGLIGKPQAKQGWHIKVSVDADNAPGGAKHKVFWLKCAETPAAGTSAGGTTTPVTTTSGTTATTTTSTTNAATTTESTQTSGTSAGAATAAAPAAAAATTVTGGAAAAAAAPAAAAPAAQPASSGSALPFTGSNIATMLLIALAALLVGGFAIRAGRRRASQL
ncbi:MAG: hypothetical protein QOE05_3151 [Actinomycetota bacterium]|nr:hypothetical protein [Actinomycetota bacterium]